MIAHRFPQLNCNFNVVYKKSLNALRKITPTRDFVNTSSSNFNSFKDESFEQQPNASSSLLQIKKSLKMANIEYQDGATNLKTACPVCDQPKDIYINKTTGHFLCPSCHYGGKLGLIEKFFTTSRSQKTTNELKMYKKLFQNAKAQFQSENQFNYQLYERDYEPVSEQNVDKIFKHFSLDDRIPKNSLSILNARYNEERQELLFPLYDILGSVVGCKIVTNNRTYNENDECRMEICFPDQHVSGLISYNNLKISKAKQNEKEIFNHKAIVVLSLIDLLALTTTKINATFICLPHGLKFLPQECLPALDQYSELTLWFNYNVAGWDVARNFAKKLDEKRCKFVRPTSSHPTPYKALSNNIDIKGIYSKSTPILHKAITTFSSLRQDVLSDLQNIDKVQGVKWKRYPTLNKYLKGHRKGELTILTGPTGCGKTTFMSEYSLDLAMQGVNTLWGSFEIRNTRLATTLLRQFCGKPLLDSISDENLIEFEYWANKFEELPIYFMTFHGQQQIKVVMEAIEHAQYVHDINHVIIDNVQFMMGTSEESKHLDRFWKQDVIIAAFRTFATRKNCHVTLVIHPRKEKDSEDLTTQSIFGGAKATQEADNVLIIQDKRLTSIRGKKYLQIAKNRYSGDLGIMPLEFDKDSLSYASKSKKKVDSNETIQPSSSSLALLSHGVFKKED